MNANDTMDLLDWRPPHSRTMTSRRAADEIEPSAETLRGRLLAVLRAHPLGLTDEEMQVESGMNGSTQRPRRQELEKAGLVYKTIQTRRTASGRLAIVWRAA
jgi:hypothetical protein